MAAGDDRERARQHLLELFRALNQWEAESYLRHLKDGGRAVPAELAARARLRTQEELDRIHAVILNRFCTRKPRGAGAGFRVPPTFDMPERMEVVEARTPLDGRLELLTSEWNGRAWKFVLVRSGALWLLDGAFWLDPVRQQWCPQPL